MGSCHETIFKDLHDALVELIEDKENRKDLAQCDEAVHQLFETTFQQATTTTTINTALLESNANAVVDYCNEAILQYHFSQVPGFWRRLLIDGGLLQCLVGLKSIMDTQCIFKELEPKIQKIMCNLDTCCVVSGSPGKERRFLVDIILDQLQTFLTQGRGATTIKPVNKHKRQKLNKETKVIQYPVKRITDLPSFEWFLNYCNQEIPTPFIMSKGLMDDWPASHKWSIDYLLAVAGDRVVPVEIGSQYTEAQWSQQLMRLSEFIDTYVTDTQEQKAYLAQHDVFYQIPKLENDIIVPDYCYVEPRLTHHYEKRPNDVLKNAWFGPVGTVSPLHHDPYHNLLAQVMGSKYIRLVSPIHSELVYPREGIMSNTSQVDIECPNYKQFPLFEKTPYLECILEAGEVLYIPPKWWHYVKSLETSFSVSLWF